MQITSARLLSNTPLKASLKSVMHPYARAVVDLHSLKDGTHPNAIALQQMDLSSLSQYFHLRINDVARKLGVCATVLKKVCRKHGIPRWPQRKLASIDRRLAILKRPRRRVGSKEARRVQHEIDFLAAQRDLLLKDPAAVMGTCGNEDSKCPFEQEIDFSNSNADTAGNNSKNGYMFKSGFSSMYGNFLQGRTDDEEEDFDEDDDDEESLDGADANSNQHNKEAKTSAPDTLSPLDHAVAKSPLRDFMTRTNASTMGGMHKNYSSDSLASLQSNTSAASMNLATLAMASTAMLASPSPSLSRPLSHRPSTTATLPTIQPTLDPQRAAPLAPPLPHLLPLPADVRLPSLRFAAAPLHNPFSADTQNIHASNHQQHQDSNHEYNHEYNHDHDDDDDDDDEIESDYDSPLPAARPAFSALLRRCGSFPALNVSH